MLLQKAAGSRHDVAFGGKPFLVVPLCTSSLMHLGLERILSGTDFAVWHEAIRNPSQVPEILDSASLLFIVDGNDSALEPANLISCLKMRFPGARIVILADHFKPDAVLSAREAGVDGFCLSSSQHDVLIKSLELVMLGEVVLPSEVILKMSEDSKIQEARVSSIMERAGQDHRKLSQREAQILNCIREGAPNKVIARRLNLSEATVKVHVKAILKKIGACNRTQAALWATRHVLPEETTNP